VNRNADYNLPPACKKEVELNVQQKQKYERSLYSPRSMLPAEVLPKKTMYIDCYRLLNQVFVCGLSSFSTASRTQKLVTVHSWRVSAFAASLEA